MTLWSLTGFTDSLSRFPIHCTISLDSPSGTKINDKTNLSPFKRFYFIFTLKFVKTSNQIVERNFKLYQNR
jgi:hypothetical protein